MIREALLEMADTMNFEWKAASQKSGTVPVASLILYEELLRHILEGGNVGPDEKAIEELAKQILIAMISSPNINASQRPWDKMARESVQMARAFYGAMQEGL